VLAFFLGNSLECRHALKNLVRFRQPSTPQYSRIYKKTGYKRREIQTSSPHLPLLAVGLPRIAALNKKTPDEIIGRF